MSVISLKSVARSRTASSFRFGLLKTCARLGAFVGAMSVLCSFALPASRALAENNFYRGKTITILVGSSAGGGYDLYARAFAQFLGAHIPGKPSVIVQDMPGAGSLTSVLYLDNSGAPDGTYMTIFNSGLLTQAVTAPAQAKVDFRKVNWIGSVTPDLRICYTLGASNIKGWDDFKGSKPVTLGATGQSSVSYNDVQMLKNVFGRNIRNILGYPGRSEVHLAIRRGELDGECGSTAGLPDDFLKNHLINIPFKMVNERIDGVPDSVPYIGDFAKTDEQRKILKILTAPNEVGRPFVVSARIPADRLAILRKAFDDTVKDPGFLKIAQTEQLSVFPMNGQKAQDLVSSLYAVDPETAAKAASAIK